MSDADLTRIYNYRSLSSTLSTSGQPTLEQFQYIQAAGFAVVINLGLPDDAAFSLPEEQHFVECLHMRYIHLPVPFDAPTAAHFSAFQQALAEHADAKVWVHCVANVRALIFCALAQAAIDRKPDNEAFRALASIWEPSGIWADFIATTLVRA